MMSPAQFAEAALSERFSKLVEEVNRCTAKAGVDEVHDLRVAIRRFSQALRIFGPMLAVKPVKRIRKALAPVLEAAAAVRDLDVGSERLIEEGLDETDPLLVGMRAERHREELALRGRLLLLKSKEPEKKWPQDLSARVAKKLKDATATQASARSDAHAK